MPETTLPFEPKTWTKRQKLNYFFVFSIVDFVRFLKSCSKKNKAKSQRQMMLDWSNIFEKMLPPKNQVSYQR